MRSFRSLGLSWILWDLIAFLRFRSVLDLECFQFLGVFQRENHFSKFERGLEIIWFFFSVSWFFSVSTVGLCFSSFSFYNSYFEEFLSFFGGFFGFIGFSLRFFWDFWDLFWIFGKFLFFSERCRIYLSDLPLGKVVFSCSSIFDREKGVIPLPPALTRWNHCDTNAVEKISIFSI